MTFDEFWENNYAKAFGDCEPYYGIASHAFEAGRREVAGSLATMFGICISHEEADRFLRALDRAVESQEGEYGDK